MLVTVPHGAGTASTTFPQTGFPAAGAGTEDASGPDLDTLEAMHSMQQRAQETHAPSNQGTRPAGVGDLPKDPNPVSWQRSMT